MNSAPISQEPFAVMNQKTMNSTKELDIAWESNQKCIGSIKYGKTPDKMIVLNDSTETNFHHFFLQNLEEASKYAYGVICGPENIFSLDPKYQFSTEMPKQFIVSADPQTSFGLGHAGLVFKAIAEMYPTHMPLLELGDFV